MDVALLKITSGVVSIHLIFLVSVFFIYQTDQKSVIISDNNAPVIFTRTASTSGKSSVSTDKKAARPAARRTPKGRNARGAQQTSKKMNHALQSLYPATSLKNRPVKKTVSNTAEVPLFSPIKQGRQEKIKPQTKDTPKIAEIKPESVPEEHPVEQEDTEDTPIFVETGSVPEYEPVYNSLIQYWVLPQGLKKGLVCTVRVTINPDGTSVYEFIRTSGVLAFDTAVRAALVHARYPQTIKPYTKTVEFRS